MSFSARIIKSRNNLIQLVTGISRDKKAWWIVKVNPAKAEMLKVRLAQSGLNLKEYGEILFKGWGENAPEDILQKIKEEYS